MTFFFHLVVPSWVKKRTYVMSKNRNVHENKFLTCHNLHKFIKIHSTASIRINFCAQREREKKWNEICKLNTLQKIISQFEASFTFNHRVQVIVCKRIVEFSQNFFQYCRAEMWVEISIFLYLQKKCLSWGLTWCIHYLVKRECEK
jgi:hypothetical protein